jgi:transposase
MEDWSMPSPIPVPVRQVIFQRWTKGESVPKLAEELGIAERTLRHLVRRFAGRGEQAVIPDYARCSTKIVTIGNDVYEQAMQMRRQHPTWGAGLIRVLLLKELDTCPSERTLQRWFQRNELSPAPAGRRPAREATRAHCPHEVWQMDAAERILLANGQRVSWLRLVDECSGAVLQTTIFPPRALESSRARGGATGIAPGVFPMGTAGEVPGRQRQSVGFGG